MGWVYYTPILCSLLCAIPFATCSACPVDHYSSSIPEACIQCPTFSSSPANSSFIASCACDLAGIRVSAQVSTSLVCQTFNAWGEFVSNAIPSCTSYNSGPNHNDLVYSSRGNARLGQYWTFTSNAGIAVQLHTFAFRLGLLQVWGYDNNVWSLLYDSVLYETVVYNPEFSINVLVPLSPSTIFLIPSGRLIIYFKNNGMVDSWHPPDYFRIIWSTYGDLYKNACPYGGICEPGFWGQSDSCTPCEVGKYTNTRTLGPCTLCTQGKFANLPGATTCKICPPDSYEPNITNYVYNISSCGCNAGYEKKSNGECEECRSGHYNTAGFSPCSTCTAGSFQSKTNASTCVLCTNFSTSGIASTDISACLCVPGYMYNASQATCTQCVSGKYKSSTRNEDCRTCPSYSQSVRQFTSLNNCHCNAGYYGNAIQGCNICPLRSYSLFNSTTVDKCTCDSMYYKGADSVCICKAGTSDNGNGNCTVCAAGTTNVLGGSEKCTMCPTGSWKSSTGAGSCNICPDKTTSPLASTSANACVCIRGTQPFSSTDKTCVLCAAGRFKNTEGPDSCFSCDIGLYSNGLGNTNCTSCPAFSTTRLTRSTLPSDCICDVGAEEGSTSGTCVPCARGFQKSVLGPAKCEACTDLHTMPSSSRVACECNKGYYGNYWSCMACDTGKYKNSSGQRKLVSPCSWCPVNSTSVAGSGECTCSKGNTWASIGRCLSCRFGEYVHASGVCKTCPNIYSSSEITTAFDSGVSVYGCVNFL